MQQELLELCVVIGTIQRRTVPESESIKENTNGARDEESGVDILEGPILHLV